MFDNKIKFLTSKKYLEANCVYPEVTKLNIPDWYKNLNHTPESFTVKGCMPFLDTLTTGYILKMPLDFHIHHNFIKNESRSTFAKSQILFNHKKELDINVNSDADESHPPYQVGDKCPFLHKNKDLQIHKILNPWVIKTPPGYSCLFVPPLNNADDRFSIIAGIVDTDTFTQEINFPFVINGDKYPVLDTVVKMGTPYVQVIPFKRESWKMEIGESKQYRTLELFKFHQKYIHKYKNWFWRKKSWK